MARPLRIEFPGAFYHITAHGNERQAIYRTDTDRQRFLVTLTDVGEQFHLLVHAYALMVNHYHLLVETLEANVQRAMRALGGTFAQAFNRSHRRVGHLFQGRYRALLVERDAYLVELSRYLHLNPVRAGMVSDAEQYRWSSTRAYVGREPAPRFLTLADVLGHFGSARREAQRRYREFLRDPAAMCSGSPLQRVVGQTLLGSDAWVTNMRARVDATLGARRGGREGGDEVPALRQLRRRPTLAQAIGAVAAETGVSAATLGRPGGGGVARALAMYVAHRSGGLSERQIGTVFGVHHFAVSKAVAAVARNLACDPKLARLLRTLNTRLRSPQQ